jgi:hypothetical protein|tara:strand:+ start:242 stop:436 length:195 start_codon:yes stop_codon:yes gene_type:complete
MALDNKTVLENLTKQRDEMAQQLETARVTLIKLEGAIDVLQQIEDSAKEEDTETAETEVVAENE